MRPSRAFGVNHHNHFSSQQAETDEARFAIVLSYVFTRDSEVVPNCIASGEVKPRRACALSFLDDPLNFDSLPCEALR